jgi:DNA polymerase-3 subunit delta'
MQPPGLPFPWQLPQWNQLAQQLESGQLAHAHLLCGENGLGKQFFAAAFARYMLCSQKTGKAACGECRNCLLSGTLQSSRHPDIMTIAPEAGSKIIKIEQIRTLGAFVSRSSHSGSHKIIVINHAHRLNGNAANALLKTLEEPTAATYLFLVTDLPGSLPATIRSRCQRLLFTAATHEIASSWLAGKVDPSEIDTLLALTHCRPLLALDYADAGLLQSRQEFLGNLGAVLQRQTSIQSVVKLAGKLGETSVLGYLSATSSILIKYLLTNQRPPDADQAIDNLWSIFELEKMTGRSVAVSLLSFYEESQKARRELAGSTNPNSQSIMESLLWQWSKLADTGHRQ